MKDGFGRTINYARISVTDLCNFRCRYCMPNGVEKKSHSSILSLEELEQVSDALSLIGVAKQRITGGEPLVRKNVISLFNHIGANPGVNILGVTTNGVNMTRYASELKEAGVTNVNISIDTLDDEKFRFISKAGELSDVKRGIEETLQQNFAHVKLNSVLLKGINDDEIKTLANFAKSRGISIRFIELMPFSAQQGFANEFFISSEDIAKKNRLTFIPEKSETKKVSVYAFDDGTEVSFISPVSNKFCSECNRVRITADGKLLNCLHECKEYDLKPYINDKNALCNFIEECVGHKPKEHNIGNGELQRREMDDIGG